MPNLRAWFSRLLGLFRQDSCDQEITAEIQEHIDLLVERNIAGGMSVEEAHHAALRQFGGIQQFKEIAREQRLWRWGEEFFQDLRFGIRMLFRNPGFSALTIACLTIGIGTNAAVLSWIEGILFRPYPAVAHQERMFALGGTTRGSTGGNGLSYPDFVDLEKNCSLLEAFIVDRIIGTTLSIGDRAERAAGGLVTANFFDALGVHPILGRGFRPDEGKGRNAHPVMVISHQMWKDRYKKDPEIIGKTQYLNGVPHTIIGVAPENFYGTFIGYSYQFWVPISMQETFDPTGYHLEDRAARWIEGYVFLKPGVNLAQAQEEISAVARGLENDYSATNRGSGVQLLPLAKTPFNGVVGVAPVLQISLVVVMFVLLIACANVSNLLLLRSLLRRHEMTVRMAVGARRGRLVKQLLTEGLMLSLIAGVGGVIVAYWCRNALVLAFPAGVPGIIVNYPGQIDWRVLGVCIGICMLATILSGIMPALQASHIDLSSAMKTDSSGIMGGRARSKLRSPLVILQVCLSFVLIAGAGLLLQSLQRLRNADPGFSTNDVIVSVVDLFSAGYNVERARVFRNELLDHIRGMPGVQTAALARVRPFSYTNYSTALFAVDSYQPAPDEKLSADYDEVTEGYFATIGIPIVSGREFLRTDDENTLPVTIVNQTMAAKYWPGKDPVGQRLQVKGKWMQVVGVAKNSNYRTKLAPPESFFYVPYRQNFSVQSTLLIRTRLGLAPVTSLLAKEVHALDSNLAPLDTITMREQVDRMSYFQRLGSSLLMIFAGIALFLAAIGLYAVMSYGVSQSTRELGLRMALGAQASDLLRLVLSQGLAMTGGGVLVGATLAFLLTPLMTNLLYGISPRDPFAFGLAFLVLTVVALSACFVPAWRATRIDPVRALRT